MSYKIGDKAYWGGPKFYGIPEGARVIIMHEQEYHDGSQLLQVRTDSGVVAQCPDGDLIPLLEQDVL